MTRATGTSHPKETSPPKEQPAPYAPPPLPRALARTLLRLAVVLLLALGAHLLVGWAMERTEDVIGTRGEMIRTAVLIGALVAYALLIAMPFVPGIEIGISLILMRGAEIAPPVYLATVTGLGLAFLAGRLLPITLLRRAFLDLRLTRACQMLDRIHPLTPDQRLTLLRAALPASLGRLAVDYRYLLLAGLINMPGSAFVGGGGGICLLAGLTGLFRPAVTILTICLAVLPLPLALWLWGPGVLTQLR